MIKNILAGILSSILLFCNSNIEIIASASNGLAEVDFFSTETNDNYTEYNGHFYKRYDMNMSWDEARKYCDSLGGHLITITSQDEQNVADKLIMNPYYEGYWMGAYVENKQWHWITDELFGYQNWSPDEPNTEEDGMCLEIYTKSYGDNGSFEGQWDDTWVDGDHGGGVKSHGFICEWEYYTEYNGHSYKRYDMNMSWDEARKYCDSLGGHLITITSQDEQNVADKLIMNPHYEGYWMGAYVENKQWHWITDELFEYQNWSPDEPNTEEDGMCLEIYTKSYGDNGSFGGQWDDTWVDGDHGGGAKSHGFICEWEYINDLNSVKTSYFQNHKYELIDNGLTWNEAKDYCENLGGHLVTITSHEEQAHIENLIKKGNRNSYWLGGYKVSNNEWKWITDEEFEYTHWGESQPDNNKSSGGEDKLMIYKNINPKTTYCIEGTWNDLANSGVCGSESFFGLLNMGLICEWENSDVEENHGFNDAVYHASYIYDFYKNTDAGMNAYFYSDTPSQIFNKEAEDSGLAQSVEAWNAMQNILSAVDDPSNILDKPLEKVDLYEGIIFALFETVTEDSNFQGKSTIKKANSLMSTLKTDMEALYGIRIAEDNDFSDLTQEQKEKLSELTEAFFNDSKIAQAANVFSAVDYMSNLQEYAEYQCNCMAIIEMSESYKNILQEMYDACSLFGNESLKIALLDCISTMNKSEEYLATKMGVCAVGVAGKEIAKRGMSELWKGVKNDLWVQNPHVALIWAAYKTSNFFCDSVFNTSDIAEKTVKMDALLDVRDLAKVAYEKEKAAFANARTIENAENYLAAIDVNFNYLNEDCQTALSFVETVSDALFTKIMSLFGGDDLGDVKKQISSIQRSYALEYFSTQTAWIYGLEEDYPAEYDNYAYLLDESWNQIKEKYHIACPVNIYVYGASGELLASVENNKVFCREEAPVTLAVLGDEKEIWFYKDSGQYTVQYVGTDNGLMDISIEVYNEAGDIARKVKHIDVPLTEGIMYSSQGDIESDNCTYELKESNGDQMQPTVDTFDQNLQKYTLTINNGYIVGENYVGYTGKFYAGEKVTIYANMPNGTEFTDWKADVVSNDIFENLNSKIVTVVMPAADIVLTAMDNRNILIENISLKVSDTIKINEKIQLEALISPNTATNKTLKWITDNDSVAIVDNNGLVTALAEGNVTITVESMDGSGISASCVITVERVSDNSTDSSTDDSNNSSSGDIAGGAIEDNPTGGSSTGDSSSGTTGGSSTGDSSSGTTGGSSSEGYPSGGFSGGTTGSNPSGDSTGNNLGSSPSENDPDNGNNGELQVKLLYYIVDFNANGGNSLSRKTMTLLMDDTLGILPKIQRKQYDFQGWYTQKSGGKKVTQATVLNVSTTLYAQWTKTTKSAKPTKLSLTTKKGRKMKVSYKKVSGALGYQIAYSTSRKFVSSETKKVTTTSTSKLLKNLKKGKTYYVRVRVYQIDSAGNKVYGTYSGKKSIKIKA